MQQEANSHTNAMKHYLSIKNYNDYETVYVIKT